MKLAVIVDNGRVQRFALDALDAIEGANEITVFSCTNTRLRKRLLRHAFYYALNVASVRNRLTRFVPLSTGKKTIARRVEFESLSDGGWQAFPRDVIDALNSGGFDLVLKFGMGLLRVPPAHELPVPILSYHHGDPDLYRGRPAGFWELAEGAPVIGQVVQVISNRLDAGKIVAYAETKAYPWSYRRTLNEGYRHSPLIINRAIRNALTGEYLPKSCAGRNCRLPSNRATIAFALKMAWQLARRLAYGAVTEKAWRVSKAPLTTQSALSLISEGVFPSPSEWRTLKLAKGYIFYADPFFTGDGGEVLVEALNGRSGLGEIVRINADGHRTVLKERGHLSYPSTARVDGREIVVPETARWSAPLAYVGDRLGMRLLDELRIQANPRVLDPTLIERDGRLYLFGNISEVGSNALYLWSSDSLHGLFTLHADSPVRISPRGSRMGGALIEVGGGLVRLGQDFTHGYGDGLIAFSVETLSPDCFRERPLGSVKFTDRKGPHTLNFRSGEIVFDWYRECISPLASVRRLASWLNAQRAFSNCAGRRAPYPDRRA